MFGVFKEIFLMFEDMILTMTPACSVNVNYWRCCNTIFWIFGRCQFVRLLLIIDHCVDDDFDDDEKRSWYYWEKAKPGPATCARIANEPVYAPQLQSSATISTAQCTYHNCNTLHCTAILRYTTLHTAVLHYIKVYCSALHCTVVYLHENWGISGPPCKREAE